MATPFSSRSSGTRVQEISRQFTEPERAIDDRISTHLSSPMPQATGIDAATGYKWLEDDLKFRAAITAQLNQERDLANAQSVRQELDRKFTQDAEADAVSIDGMKRINEIMSAEPNLGWKGAASKFFSENPGAIENDSLFENVKRLSAVYESEPERASAQLAMQANDEANRLKLMDSKSLRRLYDEDPDLRYRVLKRTAKLQELGFDADEPATLAKKVEAENSYKEAVANKAKLDAIGPEGSLEANAAVQSLVGSTGIQIEDGPAIVNALRGSDSALLMLSDSKWASALSPEQKDELGKALNTFSNPSAQDAEKRSAGASVARYMALHSNHVSQAKADVEAREKLLSIGSAVGESLGDLVKKFDSFRKEPANPEEASVSDPGTRALEAADSWAKQQIISMPEAAPLQVKMKVELDKAWAEKDPQKRIQMAETAAEDFALEIGKMAKPTAAAPVDLKSLARQLMSDFKGDKNKVKEELRKRGYNVN